jgi:peroxin-4
MQEAHSRRLQIEIRNYHDNGLSYSVSKYYELSYDPDNILHWSANLHCLPVKWHEGKNYAIDIILPVDYPLSPPTVRFLNEVNCQCVHPDTGIMSCSILNKNGGARNWSPALTIPGLIMSIISILTDEDSKRMY